MQNNSYVPQETLGIEGLSEVSVNAFKLAYGREPDDHEHSKCFWNAIRIALQLEPIPLGKGKRGRNGKSKSDD